MEAPEFFQGNCNYSQTAPEKHHSFDSKTTPGGDHFIVEELLDFSNEDAVVTEVNCFDNVAGNSTDSSTVTVVDSCSNSSCCDPSFSTDIACRNLAETHFSSDLCVPPLDDLAELEWMSNIVEETFSCEDLQKLQLISGIKARPDDSSETRPFQPESDLSSNNNNDIISSPNNPIFNPEMAVPAKARSKRSRAAPCDWTSRLLVLSQNSSPSDTDIISTGPPPSPALQQTAKKTVKAKKKDYGDCGDGSGEGRKCLHCGTDKTPQWRTGPMGPKTLCNACGVRYKSGRLVPEYRPAASPTFVLTKHSNSHRKVLELRRQKEMLRAQQQQQQQQQQQFMHHHHQHHQNMMFDISNGDDYLIHQHVEPHFRQLI